MQEGRRLCTSCHELNQFCFPGFEIADLVFEDRSRHAIEDGLDSFIEIAFDALELISPTGRGSVAFHPKPVHLARKLIAECLEQLWLHQMRAQAGEYGRFESVASDV